MKKKVLFITNNKVGGAEKITVTIAKLLDKSKYIVKVIFIGSFRSEIDSYMISDFECAFLPVVRLKFSVLKFVRLLKREKPNYVFSSLLGINIPLIIASKFESKARIIVRQSFDPNRNRKYSFTTLMIRLLYPHSFKIIAQTKEMKESMVNCYKLNSDNITVLNNPIDTELLNIKIKKESPFKFNGNSLIYVAVGNIRYVKGYDILIRSFEKIVRDNSLCHLYIIGREEEKKYSKSIKDFIRENKLTSNVHLVGFSNNPYKYIYNSDCFVLPSRSEGLPNVLLESIYIGKPIVATRCVPIIDRLINQGINGYKVNVEDVDGLAEAMKMAIELRIPDKKNYISPSISDIKMLFS